MGPGTDVSIYALKGRFQMLLRPLVGLLHRGGATANQVTCAALLLSLVVALAVYLHAPESPRLYLALPVWLVLRMALNAIDGMLAREFGQQSRLGMYLNELADVVADAAIYLSLLSLPGVVPALPWLLALTAALTEHAGCLGVHAGASRRYDGPMGKSDRAFLVGLLGLLLARELISASWVNLALTLAIGLCIATTWRRVAAGLREAR